MPRRRTFVLLVLLALPALVAFGFFGAYSGALLTGRVAPWVATSIFLVVALGVPITISELTLGLLGAERVTKWRVRLLIGTLAVLLVTAELSLRRVGSLSTWQEQNGGNYASAFGLVLPKWLMVFAPNETTVESRPEFAFERRTNSEGLRDVEHSKAKPDGEYRILALGDSFTEGGGVATEDSWPRQLEHGLSSRYPKRGIKVMNAGVGGSDPWFEYMLLEQRLLAYHPDLVIVAVNNSDIFDLITRGGAERFKSDGTVRFRDGPTWEWVYASSYTFRLVVRVVLGYNHDLIRKDRWDSSVRGAFEDIYASILKFKALSVERGFKLATVFHPHADEVTREASELQPLIDRLRKEADVHVVDALDYFLEEAGVTPDNVWEYYWELDRHHNAKGYGLLADSVEASLATWGFLGPPRESASSTER